VKPNVTIKGQAVPNYRKRNSKKVKSNIDLGTHSQTFKQLRQLNDRNHHIPISTNTMLMDLILPSKGTIWWTALKRKIQQFVAYRIPISLTQISIGLGWKARRVTKPFVPKTGRSSNTYLCQSRLQTYIDQKR
jgi:hypothetical protein